MSELPDQDSYSFEVANIIVGAGDEQELLEKYQRAVEQMGLELQPLRTDALVADGTPGSVPAASLHGDDCNG
ncbi:MAG: hypothetical protein U5L11_04660 [Arhodomonas sp.]|nr:hypothetical protein [Arhodomonas sp.]